MAYYLRLAAAAAITLLSLSPAPASALAIPSVAVTLDGVVVGNPVPIEDPNKPGRWLVENYYFSNSEGQIQLNLQLDADPVLSYSSAIIDFAGPSVFGFIFGLPIVPTAAPGVVEHSESSSTTDPNGGGTPVTALPPPGGVPVDSDAVTEQFVYTLSQNGGVTLLNAGLDIRPSFVGANPGDTQAAINLGPIAGPAAAGFYDFMRVDVNFSMTGGSDAYTWNGFATVVPEPATAVLLGLGLGGLAIFGGRRR